MSVDSRFSVGLATTAAIFVPVPVPVPVFEIEGSICASQTARDAESCCRECGILHRY